MNCFRQDRSEAFALSYPLIAYEQDGEGYGPADRIAPDEKRIAAGLCKYCKDPDKADAHGSDDRDYRGSKCMTYSAEHTRHVVHKACQKISDNEYVETLKSFFRNGGIFDIDRQKIPSK